MPAAGAPAVDLDRGDALGAQLGRGGGRTALVASVAAAAHRLPARDQVREVLRHLAEAPEDHDALQLAGLVVGPDLDCRCARLAAQHVAEAHRIGVDARLSRFGTVPERACIAVTNYERLERFDPADYAGVILDESSILKSFTGATKRKLVEAFAATPYRLCCTATPAPNDHTELGQHSEFLGVMRPPEMLSRWFIAEQSNAGRYRLKKPAMRPFWDWVASWARCVSRRGRWASEPVPLVPAAA
ncbi:hypothetical protein [Methylobacterium nodulans]|uniref:hypothetical protein n=1 Tax=Methylobacterium nodulans TaxID=114616 RepID=UPI00030E4A07